MEDLNNIKNLDIQLDINKPLDKAIWYLLCAKEHDENYRVIATALTRIELAEEELYKAKSNMNQEWNDIFTKGVNNDKET